MASGRVLEIGGGTGGNLSYYSNRVTHLILLEPNEALLKKCRRRAQKIRFPVDIVAGDDLALHQLLDESFDCVVSTWVFCSLSQPRHVLREIKRLLRPGGRFIFIEHGLAPDTRVSRWQTLLSPVQRRLSSGCRLNLPIAEYIRAADFRTAQ